MQQAAQRIIETTRKNWGSEMDMFLDDEALKKLTGKSFKSHQIAQLRIMGIPFHVNSTGHPVVLKSAIEGNPSTIKVVKQAWVPRVLKSA